MYRLIEDLKELEVIDLDKPVFADIETEGLYVGTRLIQLYQPETTEKPLIIDTDKIDLDEAKNYLKNMWLVFHNASYDLGTLLIVPKELDDTLYLAKSAYPQWRQFKLDFIISKLGLGKLYSGLDKSTLQKAGFKKGAYLSQSQLQYAATDVIALSKVYEAVKHYRKLAAYKIDIANLKYAVQYEQNGLVVDQDAVIRELEAIKNKIEENTKKLNGLNPNSPKQVKEALGTSSSAKDVLIKLMNSDDYRAPLAKLVYEQRRLLKRRTMLESYNYPKVETRFNPAGAATGRFTSTGGDLYRGINAQQIPRDLQYIFNQPTEDTTVIHADFSTAELRAGCSIMKDKTMYTELKNGIDLHKAAASLVTGKSLDKITKADRQKGKAVSFGFIFGMSAPAFVEYAYLNYGVKFTLREAQEIKKKYNTKYRQISAYHNYWWQHYKDTPVTSPLGRRNMARLGTDAINYATQSGIAETTKIAIDLLVKRTNGECLNYIYNVVHDAIYLRVPNGKEREYSKLLVESMLDAWTELCKSPMLYFKDIPMGVEYEVYLTDKKEWYVQEVFNKGDINV